MAASHEDAENVAVPKNGEQSDEYEVRFKVKPMHEAVLEVVCRAAVFMGQLFGENKPTSYTLSEQEAH